MASARLSFASLGSSAFKSFFSFRTMFAAASTLLLGVASLVHAQVSLVGPVTGGDFGGANVCPGVTTPAPCSQTVTLTYSVGSATTFGTPNVVTQGTPNLDFKLSGNTCTDTVSSGGTCTISVTFAPLAPGLRIGAVQLLDQSVPPVTLATTFISGVGQGPAVAFGPGVQATLANGFLGPHGVAVDAAGNVFFGDANGNLNELPFGGGGPAVVASGFGDLYGIAVDGLGDLFVTDSSQATEITPTGMELPIGTGINQAWGVAVDGAGDVYIAEGADGKVDEITPTGAQTTLASGFGSLKDVAVDSVGNAFVLDSGNGNVVEISTSAVQNTVVDGLSGPFSMALDSAGDVFVADTNSNQVIEVAPGGIKTVVSTGLISPEGVAVDGAGDVFIADTGSGRVVEVNRSQPPSLTFAATPIGSTSGDSPQSVTIQNVGNQPLNAMSPGLAIAPSSFTQVNGPGTPSDCGGGLALMPGGSCDLSISFTPTSTGSALGAANLTDNALNVSGVTQTISLSGTGTSLTTTISISNIPASAVYGGNFTPVFAYTGDGATSASSSTLSTCTVAGGVVSFVGAGTCTLTAHALAGPTYSSADGSGQSFQIAQAAANIVVTAYSVTYNGLAHTATVTTATGVGGVDLSADVIVSGTAHTAAGIYAIDAWSFHDPAGKYADAGATITDTISQAGQIMSFTSIPYGVSPVALSATGGGSGNAVTFSVLSGPGTIVGNILTVTGQGPLVVAADQAGNANYTAAAEVTQTINVVETTQIIALPTIPNQVMGGTNSIAFGASASSGLPTLLTSATPAVCSVTGSAVMLLSYGQCSIQATQAGNAYYFPATPMTLSFQVAQETIGTTTLFVGSAAMSGSIEIGFLPYPTTPTDFSATAPWKATPSTFYIHLAGNASSKSGTGSAVLPFTIDANPNVTPRVVNIQLDSGQTVTIKQAGTNYTQASPVTSLWPGLTSQTNVAVDSSGNVYFADTAASVIDKWIPAPNLLATTSLLTLGPTNLSNPKGIAVDSAGNVYIADTGNNAIEEWNASAGQTTLVSGISGPSGIAIDRSGDVYFSDTGNNAIKEWVAATQQVVTLVSSGLNNPTGVAVDAGGNVYFADSGSSAIKEWVAVSQSVVSLVTSGLNNPAGVAVDGQGNVYIADSGNNTVKVWNASTQAVTARVQSGLVNPTGVAVDGYGDIYVADRNGESEIPLAFLAPASYTEPATGATISLLPLIPSSASLTGPFAPKSDQSWLGGISILNGTVSFTVASNVGNPARVGHVIVLGQSFTVNQYGTVTAQTITFGALSNRVLGSGSFSVKATASSGLAVSFNSQTPAICTVSGGTVALVSVGACTIQATQAGNSTYAAATPLSQSFQVTQGSQTITFAALGNRALSAGAFIVKATSNSGLTVSFTASTTGVCTVTGTTVTPIAVGTCTITASQAGNTNWAAAASVSRSFSVTQGTQTITFGTISNRTFTTVPFTVSATASSSLAVNLASTTPTVCTVSGSSVTLLTAGTCSLQATQAGNTNWAAATPVSRSFTVSKASQTINFTQPASPRAVSAGAFTVSATASSGLAVNFASTTTTVCTVSGTMVTPIKTGTCTIQATQPGSSSYNAATAANRNISLE
jgi:YVTN family beta-propeller protein